MKRLEFWQLLTGISTPKSDDKFPTKKFFQNWKKENLFSCEPITPRSLDLAENDDDDDDGYLDSVPGSLPQCVYIVNKKRTFLRREHYLSWEIG